MQMNNNVWQWNVPAWFTQLYKYLQNVNNAIIIMMDIIQLSITSYTVNIKFYTANNSLTHYSNNKTTAKWHKLPSLKINK